MRLTLGTTSLQRRGHCGLPIHLPGRCAADAADSRHLHREPSPRGEKPVIGILVIHLKKKTKTTFLIEKKTNAKQQIKMLNNNPTLIIQKWSSKLNITKTFWCSYVFQTYQHWGKLCPVDTFLLVFICTLPNKMKKKNLTTSSWQQTTFKCRFFKIRVWQDEILRELFLRFTSFNKNIFKSQF